MKKTSEDQVIIYKSDDGTISVDVHFEAETAWLTQDQMASLFQTDRTNITKHIKNIYETKELDQTITSAKFAQHLADGRIYQVTQQFFATVQNKMHYAVHGNTATELISKRADAKKPLMGLTSFKSDYITAADAHIAKNYLDESEIKQLNLIVSLYLDFAELQATNNRPMKMVDWIQKLDEFLKLSEKRILIDSGKISAKSAETKANTEYKKYRTEQEKKHLSDFDKVVKKILKKARN